MLDAFEILTTSGIVLWRRHYADLSSNVVDSLVKAVLIEEQPQKIHNAAYKKDRYTLQWTLSKDFGLVFVAVYQSLLHLSWVAKLLEVVKELFLRQFGAEIRQPGGNVRVEVYRGFDGVFDGVLRKLDTGSSKATDSPIDSEGPAELTPPSSSGGDTNGDDGEPPPPPVPPFRKPGAAQEVLEDTSADATPVPTPETSRPTTPASHIVTGKAGPGKASRRARKAHNLASSAPVSSGDESSAGRKSKAAPKAKSKRRWDASGAAIDDDEDTVLDYSASDAAGQEAANATEREAGDVEDIDASQMGSRTGKGQFILKDLDDEVDAILASSRQQKAEAATEKDESSGLLGSAKSRLTGLFANVVGGRTLTKADLQGPLDQMRNHLLEKNVAREAADRLVSSVETDLLNQKTASFTSIDKTIRESMGKALTRILTPTSSLDLLRNVTTTTTGPGARPYVISIVGVNGVGKSTNLSKIAYFLLQNQFRVLVVAGDTFRSGAVEQLRVHVNNLTSLSRREQVGQISLFEQGYGKDAATVARDAVSYATKGMLFDVVLIDTAGRRHNDSRLMSSLTKFGQLANPDKIFMVGEALVGTDSVAQARHFAEQFVDSKGKLRNNGTGMDGFIISKCDTVGDMVGTLVSMVHATGIPVVFLGVGQHYGDLRGLNVGWAVDKLMK